MATSGMGKDAENHIPYCKDQGLKNLSGAYARGVAVQYAVYTMTASPEAVTFAALGLGDMADTQYAVITQNQTDVADPGTVTSKTTKGFTITGPDAADIVDIVVIGRLAGQLA